MQTNVKKNIGRRSRPTYATNGTLHYCLSDDNHSKVDAMACIIARINISHHATAGDGM